MFKFQTKIKRATQLLMSIGLLSVIISFYFANDNQYSDEEIDKIVEKIALHQIENDFSSLIDENIAKNQVMRPDSLPDDLAKDENTAKDQVMKSETLPDKLTKSIYLNLEKKLECHLHQDEYFSNAGDIINIFKNGEIGESKKIDKQGFVRFSGQIGELKVKGFTLGSIKNKILNRFDANSSVKKDITDITITHRNSISSIKKATKHYFHAKSNRPWSSLLFNNYFFLGIAVFGVFFVALQYVAEAGWSIVLKRVPEAIMGALPVMSLIMLFFIAASIMHWNHIYHWLHEGVMTEGSAHYDKIIAGKEPYLNATGFIIRTVIYLLSWNYFAKKLRSLSVLEDREGGTSIHFKGVRTSAWFMVFFAVTSAMASWDWIMSIDTHWFSTIFGWYIFAEWSAIGFTTVLLFTLYLKRNGYLKDVNENHIHDLGKWIFAFSLVWTYIWFSQFMLIWYANIPEEVTYFTARLEVENYKFLFWFSMIINFIAPIILLMSRDAKRNNGRLIFVSCIILLGHWLNSYLLVTPGTLGSHGHIGFTEIGMGLGFAGLFIYLVLNALTKQPLETKNHPFLDESKHLHT